MWIPNSLPTRLLEVLRDEYSAMLAARYKLEKYDLRPLQGYELLELIGRKRGMLASGGEIDTERASIMVLDEFRSAKLGKITLERSERLNEFFGQGGIPALLMLLPV